ncbi:MAG: 30S ribosomal protein S12 methylthiotransferase RimO [Desulfofustis sp.]|nr:30S ribosomal protein S12 methylthiotransferase RimO [Desulfofustis sp.]
MNRTFHLVSLGCPKNLVDSEVVYGLLEKAGWNGVDEPEEAAVLLINTCGFIQPAVEESIEEILQLATYKSADPSKKLVVIGCLVQRYREKLEAELEEVDLFVGTEGVVQVAPLLNRLADGIETDSLVIGDPFLMTSALPRRRSTPFFRAWLKITEGCDNRCSYCMIPSIRGRLRSRSEEDLVEESRALVDGGVRELSLVAQDLTAYGTDLCGERRLESLVRKLLDRTSVDWIRLLYLYPSTVSPELIDIMAENDRIVPYLDIPLQHVSTKILKAMNRRYNREVAVDLVAEIRKRIPDAALRTTLLLGFPGETEDDVKEVESFLRDTELDHVGVFAYANEEGSAAEKFSLQVEEDEIRERLARIITLQSEISQRRLRRFVSRVEPVLIEGVSRETDLLLEGRTRYQAPDIDGCVLINEGDTRSGEIVEVEITEAQIYDLVGRIV